MVLSDDNYQVNLLHNFRYIAPLCWFCGVQCAQGEETFFFLFYIVFRKVLKI